jgi:hypothetical protein
MARPKRKPTPKPIPIAVSGLPYTVTQILDVLSDLLNVRRLVILVEASSSPKEEMGQRYLVAASVSRWGL